MRLYTAISLTKRHKKRLERDKLCSGTRLDIRIDIGPLRKLYCDETPPAKKSLSGDVVRDLILPHRILKI